MAVADLEVRFAELDGYIAELRVLLAQALGNYPGTLVFVSHDRELVCSLATRILDTSEQGITDFSGSYDDDLRSQGLFG